MTVLVRPIVDAFHSKLGRCQRCMRLSWQLALALWMLLAITFISGQSPLMSAIALTATLIVTSLSLAHGVAYVVRAPEPRSGCSTCQQKAKARVRAGRTRRRWQNLLRWRFGSRAQTGKCRTCRQRWSQQEMIDFADDLPTADADLIAVVEASPEFAVIRDHLAISTPVDTWQANMRNHFLYQLQPRDGATMNALFVARWEDERLLSASVITTSGDGGEPSVRSLQ
jgi:hypothetical protein